MAVASRRLRAESRDAFTLLELLTVVVVVGILATMLLPTYAHFRSRAEHGTCVRNLGSLYTAASAYVMDQGHWPQIPVQGAGTPAFAAAWIRSFEPYGVGEDSWICPSLKRTFPTRDPRKPLESRAVITYAATPFDDNPRSPYKWDRQPWFAEMADSHGEGNLLIFSNGQVKSLREVLKTTR